MEYAAPIPSRGPGAKLYLGRVSAETIDLTRFRPAPRGTAHFILLCVVFWKLFVKTIFLPTVFIFDPT